MVMVGEAYFNSTRCSWEKTVVGIISHNLEIISCYCRAVRIPISFLYQVLTYYCHSFEGWVVVTCNRGDLGVSGEISTTASRERKPVCCIECGERG